MATELETLRAKVEAAQALAAKATPGPWRWGLGDLQGGIDFRERIGISEGHAMDWDLELAASAPSLVTLAADILAEAVRLWNTYLLMREGYQHSVKERDEARAELTAIRAVLGNGADEAAWPPGLTVVEAVGRLRELVNMASGFEISEPTVAARSLGGVRVERCGQLEGPDLWAVRQRGNVLGRDGHWTYEPIPSSRDDAFIAEYRFASRDDAIKAGRAAIAGAPPPRCTATSRERTVEIGGHMHTVRTRCPLPAGHEGPHAESLGDNGGPND